MSIIGITKAMIEDIEAKLEDYLRPYNNEVHNSKICFTLSNSCGYYRGKVLGFQAFADNIKLSNTVGDFRIMFDPSLTLVLEEEYTKKIMCYELNKIRPEFWISSSGKHLNINRYLSAF